MIRSSLLPLLGDFSHGAEEAASTHRRLDLGKSLGDFAIVGLFLELGE